MPPRPSSLRSLVTALTANLDLHTGLQAHRVVELWPQAAGPAIASHAWAHTVHADTLIVHTDSPVWSHQLQMLEPELVGKLAAAVGPDCPIKHIRFRSGSRADSCPGKSSPLATSLAAVARSRAAMPRGLPEPGAVREATDLIDDLELARALGRALAAQISPEATTRHGQDQGD